MEKICILLFSFSFSMVAFAQKKTNSKIGKNETEITSFIMADDDLAYGVQLVYRFSVLKKLKTGAGIFYGANYNAHATGGDTHGYGAVFADVLQFLGQRQKWSIGGQIGHGFYNHDYIKAGIYYSISGNYRAIVSKKLLFTTSLFFGYRSIDGGNIYHLVGLKAGLVF